MPKLFIILYFLIPDFTSIASHAQVPEREYDYVFFENSIMPDFYYFSSVNYSEDAYVKNTRAKIPVCDTHFFTPPNSLSLEYETGNGNWEATVIYERIRGQDHFKEANHLSFWLYMGNTPQNLLPDIGLIHYKKNRWTNEVLKNLQSNKLPLHKYITGKIAGDWTFVKIPLADFGKFEELPNQVIFSNNEVKGDGRILIDQLELFAEKEQVQFLRPTLGSAKACERHVDLTWDTVDEQKVKYIKIYRSLNGQDFRAVGIQRPYFNRYSDYTGEPDKTYFYKISLLDFHYNESELSSMVQARTKTMNDDELLDMVQEASFRYYWEGAEPYSGLARENIPGRKNMIATGASGFGIMAILVAVERGFINREEAVQRLLKITAFLQRCERFHGAVPHFIDGPTGKVEPFFGQRDNGGDLVETSFLFQGLLAARQYFDKENQEEKEIRESITRLWETVEWNWYDREKENKYLTWHWSPDKEWVIDHKLIGWNETMITYILAMASPTYPVSTSMYYNGWASQEERTVKYRTAWGKTEDGSKYVNGNFYHGIELPVGVANGGPLFFIHYSYMGLNPHKMNDKYTNYFENNKRIALINWRYCSENPNHHPGFGEDFWGITASDGPWGYRAAEPVKEKEQGTLAPTGALASFPYTPDQSMAALKNLYRNHGKYLWGEYGFRDAVNLEENWAAKIYMGLNQAPVTVMIENFRSGLIWDFFMQNNEMIDVLEHLEK